MLDLQNCQKIKTLIHIEIAAKADIEILARVETESKLRSYPEYNDADGVDYNNRLYQWTKYFNGETPVGARSERVVFKAVKGEHVVGLIAGHLTNRYGKSAEIQKLYVLKEEQRKGIASDLLKSLLTWLFRHHSKSLCVGIDPENPYQKFYIKYGGLHLNPHRIYWDDLAEMEQRLKIYR
ncbi:MAG: family N-acetyltransferase [Mucilaginibacter sp.]|nr:family N-acetyltransferase [Mucilaginibacter sp.]